MQQAQAEQTPSYGLSIEQFLDGFAQNPDWRDDPINTLGQMPSIDSIMLEMARIPVNERALIREKLRAFQAEIADYVDAARESFKKQVEATEKVQQQHDALAMFKQSKGMG